MRGSTSGGEYTQRCLIDEAERRCDDMFAPRGTVRAKVFQQFCFGFAVGRAVDEAVTMEMIPRTYGSQEGLTVAVRNRKHYGLLTCGGFRPLAPGSRGRARRR